jgi:hypothetical protein
VFKDVAEFVDDELALPIKGKVYRVAPVDALVGLKLQRLLLLARLAASGVELSPKDAAELELDDNSQAELYKELLGSTYDEMITDGVSYPHLERAGNTAVAFFVGGMEAAEAAWSEAPGKPEPKRPQDRRPRKTAASRSGSTTSP